MDDITLISLTGHHGTPRKVGTNEAGAIVIGEMLDKYRRLIPAPINGWLCGGAVFRWFKTGSPKKKFEYSPYHFKGAIGSEESMAMCSCTMDDTNH
eukprot:12591766-Ditylum_brightwellii.AAC.1